MHDFVSPNALNKLLKVVKHGVKIVFVIHDVTWALCMPIAIVFNLQLSHFRVSWYVLGFLLHFKIFAC